MYARAADAIDKGRYQYRGLGQGRFCVTNTVNGHIYTFELKKADCNCVDNVTNVYKIPCVHTIFILLRLKLSWSALDLSVRRNIRNSLIQPTSDGWKILGPPEGSEDVMVEKFWEDQRMQLSGDEIGAVLPPSGDEFGLEMASSGDDLYWDANLDSKDELEDVTLPDEDTDLDEKQLMRLPTGKTATRLAREYFRQIHDGADILKDAAFNLQGALRVSENQERYALDWMKKLKGNATSLILFPPLLGLQVFPAIVGK